MVPPVPKPGDEVRDAPLGLLPQLRPRRAVVRLGVVRVGVLVGIKTVRRLARDAARGLDVVVGRAGLRGGRDDDHVRAERLQVPHLLDRSLLGHDEDAAVAADGRRQREPDAGVARGGLDDGAAGLQGALALGGVDHRDADAVFDRVAGVEALHLRQHGGLDALNHPVQLDERRAADEMEDVLVVVHKFSASDVWEQDKFVPTFIQRNSARPPTAARERVPRRSAQTRAGATACRRMDTATLSTT